MVLASDSRHSVHPGIQEFLRTGVDFPADAELGECTCPCGHEEFEITVGVSLYEGSEDVKWLYLGCRCPKCGLTATYGDWKNEFVGYKDVVHSFTVPGADKVNIKGMKYDKAADEDSWKRMLALFKDTLGR